MKRAIFSRNERVRRGHVMRVAKVLQDLGCGVTLKRDGMAEGAKGNE